MSCLRSKASVVVPLCCILLGACGGGGSGSSTTPPPSQNPPLPQPPPPAPATYTVTGTVSGLSSPVVLQVSGAADMTLTANGPVTFLTGVASGTAYAISVRTQPTNPHQDCTVTNGAGTVSANVGNVAIQCVDIPLALSSSTPANSAAAAARDDDLVLTFSLPLSTSVPASTVTLTDAAGPVPATFVVNANQIVVTPSRRLLPVMAHTLTVGTAIRGTGGEQIAAPVSVSFTTADGAWGPAQAVETRLGNPAWPQIAFDSNGHALAVWQDVDTQYQIVLTNRYVPGTGWGSQLQQIGISPGTVDEPQVAVTADGNAVAVWTQDDDGPSYANVMASRYDVDTNDWANPTLVDNNNQGTAWHPQVAIDEDGDAVIVWQQHDGQRFNIAARRSNHDNSWGVAMLIETDNSSAAGTPEVASAANGDAIAVWFHFDGSIHSNRYVAGIGWSGATLIETDAEYAAYPKIASQANGNAMVVWQQNGAIRTDGWANRYVAGSGWTGAERFETGDVEHTQGPQVALDANGNAIAVWRQHAGQGTRLWASRYAAGTGWGEATLIQSVSAHAVNPRIASDSRGNAIAVWEQYDGVRMNIWANRYVAGAGWREAVPLENEDPGEATAPQIAIDADGNAIAIWLQHDGQRNNVKASRFE